MNLKLREKENELNNLIKNKDIKNIQHQETISIIISTLGEKVICPLICKNTDKFSNIEKKFYKEYPEYSSKKNIFTIRGKMINSDKSLDENNIKNNDIILLN